MEDGSVAHSSSAVQVHWQRPRQERRATDCHSLPPHRVRASHEGLVHAGPPPYKVHDCLSNLVAHAHALEARPPGNEVVKGVAPASAAGLQYNGHTLDGEGRVA